ncbi:MAG: SDR family NAD(P)-dependent oxidoreductase, partial [Myxococcota bacterium]
MAQNRAAVVTGAGRGIGRALALALADLGYPVALQSRTLTQLEAVQAQIEARGGQAICVRGDVTEEAAATELVQKAVEAFGGVQVAVACAGQAVSSPLLKTSTDTFA